MILYGQSQDGNPTRTNLRTGERRSIRSAAGERQRGRGEAADAAVTSPRGRRVV